MFPLKAEESRLDTSGQADPELPDASGRAASAFASARHGARARISGSALDITYPLYLSPHRRSVSMAANGFPSSTKSASASRKRHEIATLFFGYLECSGGVPDLDSIRFSRRKNRDSIAMWCVRQSALRLVAEFKREVLAGSALRLRASRGGPRPAQRARQLVRKY